MSNERKFPATVELGDDIVGRYALPVIPGYSVGSFDEATDPADVYKAFFSDTGNTDRELEFTATIEVENPGEANERTVFVFDLDTSLEGWQAKPYHFRIEGAWTRDSERRTLSFARGIVQVIDSAGRGVDSMAHAQTMVIGLREALKQKLDGTADIASYSIGSREISLLSYRELEASLTRYENRLIQYAGGYPAYDTGTDVV